ncbi:FHA domain-containing protein [Bdellovibrio sp. 22V]|uniref:FHA domain-containing protein n=1 Tax=Bdellovibrio sp. 22V TaxID=3044166 RepID=UPI00254290EB|nr:FHA domain-containing protein [Bdellovibrio sp. 22V]WII73381.1 FHA domain-containing protein [Bdellovibrio sp. 22V]
MSRVHLVVNRRWNQIWIEDKNSSNGTFVNGTKIVQGTPVNIVNTDKIQIGRSEYVLIIDLKTDEVEVPEPEPELPAPEEPPLEDTVAMPPPAHSMAQFQAEKALHEAKRRAAQIILEGETQAEKRVQAIYQKAREAQAQAESFYQTRMAEAHKEADAILIDFQKQGQALLHDARNMAQELREEVDVYVQSLKDKAKKDVEDLISEATLSAERLKSEALEAGRNTARLESEMVVARAQEEAERIREFTRLQNQEVQEKLTQDRETLTKVSADLQRTQEDFLAAQTQLQSTVEKEADLQEQIKNEEARIKQLLEDEANRLAELHKIQDERIKELLSNEEKKVKELKSQQQTLSTQNKALEDSVRALQEKQAQLTMDVRDLDAKKAHLFKEYEAQKIFLNEKLEKEKSQIVKSEEERLEEMRLEMSKRLQKMEQGLLDEMIRKKSSLVQEVHAAIEKEVVMLMEPAQWRKISDSVMSHIEEAVDGKVASLSQSTVTTAKPVDLMKKRKSDRFRWATVGLAMGALGYFVSQVVVDKVSADQAPMQTLVQKEAKKRQDDLEKRRFNPPQAEELKDSYTDAVIYTRNFPEIYTDQQFQQKLYKSASQYLLKTWRVDEDKSIQVLSTANALVKELTERKAKIHPDFIKEGLEKMRQLETETLARMKDVLGSEVRVESFRRFERNFYKEEVQRRRMAQH